jgi:hypothetical protein
MTSPSQEGTARTRRRLTPCPLSCPLSTRAWMRRIVATRHARRGPSTDRGPPARPAQRSTRTHTARKDRNFILNVQECRTSVNWPIFGFGPKTGLGSGEDARPHGLRRRRRTGAEDGPWPRPKSSSRSAPYRQPVAVGSLLLANICVFAGQTNVRSARQAIGTAQNAGSIRHPRRAPGLRWHRLRGRRMWASPPLSRSMGVSEATVTIYAGRPPVEAGVNSERRARIDRLRKGTPQMSENSQAR